MEFRVKAFHFCSVVDFHYAICLYFFLRHADQSAVANEIDKIGGQIVQKSPSLSDTKEECYVDVRIDPEYYRRIEDLVKELGNIIYSIFLELYCL